MCWSLLAVGSTKRPLCCGNETLVPLLQVCKVKTDKSCVYALAAERQAGLGDRRA